MASPFLNIISIIIIVGVFAGALYIFPQIYNFDEGDMDIDEESIDEIGESMEELSEDLADQINIDILLGYAVIFVIIVGIFYFATKLL